MPSLSSEPRKNITSAARPLVKRSPGGGRKILVEGGGTEVALVETNSNEGVDWFAGGAKVSNRGPNFFRLGPTFFRHVDVQQHRADALIYFGFATLHEQAAKRLRLAAEQFSNRILRHIVRQRSGNLQRQHAVVANRRPVASNGGHDDCDAE